MPEKEKKKEREYTFMTVIVCEKCGTKTTIPCPCEKCGGKVFVRKYHIIELGK